MPRSRSARYPMPPLDPPAHGRPRPGPGPRRRRAHPRGDRRAAPAGAAGRAAHHVGDRAGPPRRADGWATRTPATGTRSRCDLHAGRGDRPLPVVVFVHGGGWVLGDVRGYDSLCGHLAVSVPALVLSVDYRMAPEHKAPRAALDTVDALRWVAGAAADLGGDPSRVAVAGDSAGGNLAAVACQVLRDEGGARSSARPCSTRGSTPGRASPPPGERRRPAADRRRIDAFLGAYVGGSGLALDDPLVSPWYGDLAGLPPALVQTAEHDPLRDEGEAYGAALAAAGVATRTTRYVGVPHGFHSFPARPGSATRPGPSSSPSCGGGCVPAGRTDRSDDAVRRRPGLRWRARTGAAPPSRRHPTERCRA